MFWDHFQVQFLTLPPGNILKMSPFFDFPAFLPPLLNARLRAPPDAPSKGLPYRPASEAERQADRSALGQLYDCSFSFSFLSRAESFFSHESVASLSGHRLPSPLLPDQTNHRHLPLIRYICYIHCLDTSHRSKGELIR